jgi:hypothetical protein
VQQPNPWILFMGGIALLNVAGMAGGIHAPAPVRYTAMAACAALGVASIALGLRRYFEKKPAPPRFVPKRRKRDQVDARPGSLGRHRNDRP